ncbi:MAG: lamin tail domain-containing protein, partial [Patescibacteria group bacterium]
ISFIRSPDAHGDWTTSSASLNFFNSIEETCLFTAQTTLSPTPTPTMSNQNMNSSENIENIFISEVMVSPETGADEWIELYNDNAFEVNLKDWFIDDVEHGGSTQKKFSLTIPTYGLAVLEIKSSIFNNSGDDVRLINSLDNVIDSFTYDFSEKGKSFGRIIYSSSEFCLQIPSKNTINNNCIDDEEIENEQINSTINSSDSKNQPYITETTQIDSPSSDITNYIDPAIIETNDVLGASTLSYNTNTGQTKPFLNSLLFISCCYSLLTLLSVSLKMKLRI